MNQKIIMLVGTMAIVISIGLGTWCEEADAKATAHTKTCSKIKQQPEPSPAKADEAGTDSLLQALGASTDEEVYDAVYNGKSLADIAQENGANASDVIALQSAQLIEQLDLRLASGSIGPDVHAALKAEVPGIVARSVFGL